MKNKGDPISIDGDVVVQQDVIDLPEGSVVVVRFLGTRVFADNGVVLSIRPPGTIHLADGTPVSAVKIWDEEGLPRSARHVLDPKGQSLRVHNKYKVKHPSGEVTEDNFTGNAGMVVTPVASNRRRYECSNGPGLFAKDALIFEIEWKPFVN